MPAEFAAGAYRFGHTLVRPSYQVSDRAPQVRLFATGPDPLDPTHLGGFRPLPARLVVDWSRFLELDPAAPPQPARRLDTRLAGPLTSLPPGVGPRGSAGRSLAWLNLSRGNALGLPSGQAVAAALGAPALSRAALGLAGAPAPLWYYVLAEAATAGEGRRLGPVEATIVAEVVAAILAADPASFLGAAPPWAPFLGPRPGECTLADLVAYATGRPRPEPPSCPPGWPAAPARRARPTRVALAEAGGRWATGWWSGCRRRARKPEQPEYRRSARR
jgi:hypothetical protein